MVVYRRYSGAVQRGDHQMKFTVGDLITNGSSAGCVREHVARHPTWKTSGVLIENVSLERFNGNVGMTDFVPEYLLSSWRLVPLEWSKVVGGDLEERYVWASTAEGGGLRRELREAER